MPFWRRPDRAAEVLHDVPSPGRPVAEWASLPPLPRFVADAPQAAVPDFLPLLASRWRVAPMLHPPLHQVSAGTAGGVVATRLSPVHAADPERIPRRQGRRRPATTDEVGAAPGPATQALTATDRTDPLDDDPSRRPVEAPSDGAPATTHAAGQAGEVMAGPPERGARGLFRRAIASRAVPGPGDPTSRRTAPRPGSVQSQPPSGSTIGLHTVGPAVRRPTPRAGGSPAKTPDRSPDGARSPVGELPSPAPSTRPLASRGQGRGRPDPVGRLADLPGAAVASPGPGDLDRNQADRNRTDRGRADPQEPAMHEPGLHEPGRSRPEPPELGRSEPGLPRHPNPDLSTGVASGRADRPVTGRRGLSASGAQPPTPPSGSAGAPGRSSSGPTSSDLTSSYVNAARRGTGTRTRPVSAPSWPAPGGAGPGGAGPGGAGPGGQRSTRDGLTRPRAGDHEAAGQQGPGDRWGGENAGNENAGNENAAREAAARETAAWATGSYGSADRQPDGGPGPSFPVPSAGRPAALDGPDGPAATAQQGGPSARRSDPAAPDTALTRPAGDLATTYAPALRRRGRARNPLAAPVGPPAGGMDRFLQELTAPAVDLALGGLPLLAPHAPEPGPPLDPGPGQRPATAAPVPTSHDRELADLELADRLYDRLRIRLASELLVDRERSAQLLES